MHRERIANKRVFMEGTSFQRINASALCKAGKAEFTPPSRTKGPQCLCCYGDLMEGRVHNLAGLNLGRSLDEPCHGLQHFGVHTGVVIISADFVVPQTDGSHIDSAGARERNFVLKAVLLAE